MATSCVAVSDRGKHVLLVDDEPEVRAFLQTALRCQGFIVEAVDDGQEAVDFIRRTGARLSAVLLDVLMPRKSGLEALREIRRIDRDLPVILLSCVSSPPTVVEAMRSGATDFLSKPITPDHLREALARALSKRSVSDRLPVPPLFGQEDQQFVRITDIEPIVARIRGSDVPVLIQGETGVGKEVVARRIHAQSARSNRPFLKLNCAALPSELVESELFGYERGAFTGAFQRKVGLFEAADGGTVLLDEIGDMPYRLQAKLLQVLQDYEFQRIGGRELIRADFRVIAATHCDLLSAIYANRFREDLYYRLNVVAIRIPALRERKHDIIPLAEFLLQRYAEGDLGLTLSPQFKAALLDYGWPGNVRELENIIRKFVVLRESEALIRELNAREFAPQPSSQPLEPPHPTASPREHFSVLDEVNEARKKAEAEAVLSALNATHWNRKRAAELLKIDYKALLYKMKKLGIESGKSIAASESVLPSRIDLH